MFTKERILIEYCKATKVDIVEIVEQHFKSKAVTGPLHYCKLSAIILIDYWITKLKDFCGNCSQTFCERFDWLWCFSIDKENWIQPSKVAIWESTLQSPKGKRSIQPGDFSSMEIQALSLSQPSSSIFH